jgi:hypothetical protein
MFYIHADGTCERGGDACFNTRADAERYIATMEANATLPTPYERSRSA